MDRLSEERRSALMSKVKGKNTGPELLVRKAAHRLGYRFRLHRKDLPGKPDLMFPRLKVAIFVHGCFWHSHQSCPKGRPPKSKLDYWGPKLKENTKRDRRNLVRLRKLGWHARVIWQCETTDPAHTEQLLRDILNR